MKVKELIEEIENDAEFVSYLNQVPKRIRKPKLAISNR